METIISKTSKRPFGLLIYCKNINNGIKYNVERFSRRYINFRNEGDYNGGY